MKKSFLITFSIFFTVHLLAQDSPALITTSGEAVVYAVPDEILLSFTITTNDEEIKKAREKNRKKAQSAIEYLKNEAGISAPHIQTQYMSLRPKDQFKSQKIPYYIASQTISICITDLSKFENIIDNLLEKGITSINAPIFRTTESRKYKDEARIKAIIAAKEKAELLAGTLGQKLGQAHSINEIGNNWNASRANAYANSFDGVGTSQSTGEGFAPGQLEIRATVEVAFLLQ